MAEPENNRADGITEWSQKAYDIGFAEDQFMSFKGVRAQAMMHVAQHDALNAVEPIFEPYALRAADPRANPVAAAARAARDVLVAQYPDQRASIDALLESQLAAVPDGAEKRGGVALGRRAAGAIIAARAGDGFEARGTYEFDDRPGSYRTTPPHDGFVLHPGLRAVGRSR